MGLFHALSIEKNIPQSVINMSMKRNTVHAVGLLVIFHPRADSLFILEMQVLEIQHSQGSR
jgi:hypothetical protein